jgi:hypothetical protein
MIKGHLFSAISPMAEDISSEDDATMFGLVADCSMAAATLFMFALISSVAADTAVAFSDPFSILCVICSEMAESSVDLFCNFYPAGKVGGAQILRCQGIAVKYDGFTLGALALSPSDF